MSARRLIAAAAARLAAAGVASPRVDAELLLAGALGTSRSAAALREQIPPAAHSVFAGYVARRVAREPLQHILGEAPFRHVVVAVGPGVFVPRPETELLVDAVLPHLRSRSEPLAVDLCAGSGALAVAIANEVPGSRVIAVERSPTALPWLVRNVPPAVEVRAGDVADPELLRDVYGQVDAVVSNPPYVPAAVEVSPEVHADPADAVFAGQDGLDVIPTVIRRAGELLRAGGVLAMEHDETQDVRDLFPAALWTAVAEHDDLSGRARYVTATATCGRM